MYIIAESVSEEYVNSLGLKFTLTITEYQNLPIYLKEYYKKIA